MKLRRLGNSGLQVSVVGLGCNNFGKFGRMDVAATRAVIDKALDAGITLFDTADVYAPGTPGSSEEQMGEVLGARRKDIVLATKFGMQMDQAGVKKGGSRRYIMAGGRGQSAPAQDRLDRSLSTAPARRRHADRGDAARARRSRAPGQGALCRRLQHAGLAGGRGAMDGEDPRPQPFHLVPGRIFAAWRATRWSASLSAAAQKYGLGILPFFPLASGALTGKYRRNQAKPEGAARRRSRRCRRGSLATPISTSSTSCAFAESRGHTILELAFSWLLARPQVASVIAGATKPEQIEANAKAADWALTAEEIAEVDKITKKG